MGDLKNPNQATSFLNPLPPGSRFYPSEQQLICFYLTSKNNGGAAINNSTGPYGIDVIKEIDLYNFEPFNLPEAAGFRFGSGGLRRHWYFFVGRILKEGGGRRKAGGGYWKRKRVRDVMGAGADKVVVGTRKSFVFYLGDSPSNAVKTHWVMYEYALIDHHHHAGSFVLCRIFLKSHTQNSLSEHMISSCGDGSVASVRHVGVQCDGNVKSVVSKAQSHEKNTPDDENRVSNIQAGCGNELVDLKYRPIYGQVLCL
ncbi:OLC1v1016810C1 [Oldenlandia corymbosa var. corymbosa]|uniref:OLC1v1016810C1 n=1 Tax=Oldenlandia corymbosa var. corymbosa TaxID=529605 RepID=A0AAV1E805_OLDCO|nr:OLC1v1016810C1 [Oldenlandia corymbosa var. corymbosa]